MWFRGGSGSPLANCFCLGRSLRSESKEYYQNRCIILWAHKWPMDSSKWGDVPFPSCFGRSFSPPWGLKFRVFPLQICNFDVLSSGLPTTIAVLIYRMLKYLVNHTWNFINNTYFVWVCLQMMYLLKTLYLNYIWILIYVHLLSTVFDYKWTHANTKNKFFSAWFGLLYCDGDE